MASLIVSVGPIWPQLAEGGCNADPRGESSWHDSGHQLDPGLVDVLVRVSGSSPVTITPSANLIEDVGLDSLGFYEILIEAEECLGLRIPEQDLLQFFAHLLAQ